jgi:molybdopterin converting factor subunit 1
MQTSTAGPIAANTDPQITVTARFFALYREAAGQDRLQVAVPSATTVRDLWQHLVAAEPRLGRASAATASTAYAVNDTWADIAQVLQDGDEVAFLPPVSGG